MGNTVVVATAQTVHSVTSWLSLPSLSLNTGLPQAPPNDTLAEQANDGTVDATEADKPEDTADPSALGAAADPSTGALFHRDRHLKFFTAHLLGGLPASAQGFELNRMVLAYFATSGLDLLGVPLADEHRDPLIAAVYSMQVLGSDQEDVHQRRGGFRPSPFAMFESSDPPNCSRGSPSTHEADVAHVTMTQAALLLLTIAGDDLSGVDREAVAHHLSDCQSSSGCFMNTRIGSEQDVRFIYSACVVCEILNDWSGMDVEAAVRFLAASQRYDGGFGESPFAEGHGGTTYCAVASLALLRRLDAVNLPKLVQWVVQRQETGFNGRPNKLEDTCYSYWLGCTLSILGLLDLVDTLALQRFILRCQHASSGGISKNPGCGPDLLHTYLPIAALGLFGHLLDIAAVDPALGISWAKARPYAEARAEILRQQVAAQIPTHLLRQSPS